jgi:uncharacterized membrane protein
VRRNKIAYAVFLGAAALCVGQAFLCAPALPERMASHFDLNGAPNAWMRRSSFIAVNLVIAGVLALAFLAIAFLCGSRDESSIELPSKEYWMAPERRRETLDFLSGYFLWFGAGTLLLIFDVFRQAYRVNLGRSPALEHPIASLAVYAGFVLAWVAGFFRRFARKQPRRPTP